MSKTNQSLLDEILLSTLLDEMYVTQAHHNNFVNIIAKIDNFAKEIASENLNKWIEELKIIQDEILKGKDKKVDFLEKLNFPGIDEINTERKKEFSDKIFSFALHNKVTPNKARSSAYFKVLVIDDYFIFSIPLFIMIIKYLTDKPFVYFDFECIPKKAIERLKAESYDLILLDIDFGILDVTGIPSQNEEQQKVTRNTESIENKQAPKIAREASMQDPKIPIIVFSKYGDVKYYENLLANVLGKILKEDIRKVINKVHGDTEKKEEIIKDYFISPLINILKKYYRVKIFNSGNNLIIESLYGSSINRFGIYSSIKNPDKNIIQLKLLNSNPDEETIKKILKDENDDLEDENDGIKNKTNAFLDYNLIPFINDNKKIELFIFCRVPNEVVRERHDYYLSQLKKRIEFYNQHLLLSHNNPTIVDLNGSKYQYIHFIIEYNAKLGIKWDFWASTTKEKLIALLYRDLHYITVPNFSKISLLDIIGPIMIGPSSSHTAGANRIARLARNFADLLVSKSKTIKEIKVGMLNSFCTTGEGHGSNRAIAAGLLGLEQYSRLLPYVLNGPVKNGNNEIKNKHCIKDIAKKNKINLDESKFENISEKSGYIKIRSQDIKISFEWINKVDNSFHNNSLKFTFLCNNNEEYIFVARSWGGGNVQVSLIKSGDKIYHEQKDKELNLMREQFNGKEDMNINGLGILSKIYGNPIEEIKYAIKQINNNFEFPDKNLSELNSIEEQPPSFLNLNDLISDEEIWKTAIKYELWYLSQFPTNKKQNKLDANKLFNLFKSYYKLIEKVAEKSLEQNHLTNTKYELNIAKNLYRSKKIRQKDLSINAMIYAISINETNAKMTFPILAAPTAGSCGVIPGVLLALRDLLKEERKMDKDYIEILLTKGLLVASLIGLIITNIVPPAGASHGCQAEIGTAGAMASALATYVLLTREEVYNNKIKNFNEIVINAVPLSLDNSLGLICDPIGGRVEYPCIQRAGDKAAESINIAFKVIYGVRSKISPSDIIWVMKKVGDDMFPIYKETSRGPYANSPSAIC